MKPTSDASQTSVLWKPLVLVGATVVAYLPSLRGQFVWDDDSMLSQHGLVQAGDGLRRLWLTSQPVDYWPLTSSSFWVEWRLWGSNAAGYHATNLLLYVVGVLLLWSVLRRLALPGAFLAALIFALHPVNVESVAWIAQRKNLLALIFGLLSVGFFVQSEGRGRGWRAAAAYGLSLGAFVLAMLSKGSAAFLPVVLGGWVLWRRRPTLKDAIRLMPFVLVAAALVAVDMWFQARNAGPGVRSASAVERLLGAAGVVGFYLGKALLPVRLSFVYPQWRISAANPTWWLPLACAVTFTVLLLNRARKGGWGRRGLFAWGYFCGALVPVMGFTDVYFMRYSLVADHYEQFALISVAALAAVGWAEWANRSRLAATASAVLAVGTLFALTWRQCLIYCDTETLFRATLERNPGCWMAHNNLGVLLRNQGDRQAAKEQFAVAARQNPDYADPHNNLGLVLADEGRFPEAVAEYRQALRIDPSLVAPVQGLTAAEVDWGNALQQQGLPAEAIERFREALSSNPRLPEAYYGWGRALAAEGSYSEAVDQYESALRLKPAFAEAGNNRATALYRLGRVPEAERQLEEVVRMRPDYSEAHYNLGVALNALGRREEAKAQFDWAARLDSGATRSLQ